jgi:hypothetical protein
MVPLRNPIDSAAGFTLVCHSEECSDEESALTFLFLVKRIGKSAKQMLHFIQHDTTANCERSERYGFFFASFASLRTEFILSVAEGLRHAFAAKSSFSRSHSPVAPGE